MKTALSGIAIVLGVLGLMWWGWSNQAAAPSQASDSRSPLLAAETLYDFGPISMAAGTVSHTFAVSNQTGTDIFVKTINTSCMCTLAYLKSTSGKKGPFGMPGMGYIPPANETIRAGESRDIEVVYDPAAHGPAGVGSINRFVYLIDNKERTLTLEIRANVTP